MGEPAATAIATGLAERVVPGRAAQERAYLKSDLHHLGVPVPAIRATVRAALRNHPTESGEDVVALVDELWDAEPAVHERRMAAAEVLRARVSLLGPEDLAVVERLLRASRTWALVDGIAPWSLADLADAHPAVDAAVAGWHADEDVWIRRSALLRHLRPLREGRGDLDAFGAVADPLLEDPEFFVRKAIGWVLRDASKRDPDGVAAWIEPRAARMSALTFREATRRLPADTRRNLAAARSEALRYWSTPGREAG